MAGGLQASVSWRPLDEQDAATICTWRYEAPYDVYDYADWDSVKKAGWDLAQPDKQAQEYIRLPESGPLEAYGRIKPLDRFILIGIGLRPDLCGKGRGARVMGTLVTIAKQRFPAQIPALEVRSFNRRAISCYESCGFKAAGQYTRSTQQGPDTFLFMVYRGRQ